MRLNPGPLNLLNLLDQSLQEKEKTAGSRDYVGLSAVGRCRRQTFYRYYPERYPGINTLADLKIFQEGNTQEDLLVEQLRQCGVRIYGQQLELQFPLYPDLVKGHIDGLIYDSNADQTYLLEIKTVRMGALKRLKGAENGIMEQWPHYYMQAQVYMYCLSNRAIEVEVLTDFESHPPSIPMAIANKEEGMAILRGPVQGVATEYKPLPGPVRKCVFLIKDRNDGTVAEYWMDYDAEYVEAIILPRLATLVKAVQHDSPPDRDYDPHSHWACKKAYCNMREYCMRDGA